MNRFPFSPPFLGVRWSFPVRTEAGRTATAAYEGGIAEAIRLIMATDPGERVMRPDFGGGLRAFVFEPMNSATLESLRRRVRDALIDWEPRIDVEQVDVTPSPSRGMVTIEVRYRVRSSNSRHNVVYPFYLEEGSGQ